MVAMVTTAAVMGRTTGQTMTVMVMTAAMMGRMTSRRMDRTTTARAAAVRTMMIAIVRQQYMQRGIMIGILLLG
jgi:hypothetical protein